jgi:hypothetical protein
MGKINVTRIFEGHLLQAVNWNCRKDCFLRVTGSYKNREECNKEGKEETG